MKRYSNRSGNSGVRAYDLLPDGIAVEFADGGVYLYDHATNGKRAIAQMKALAQQGVGLATFINRHVREKYAKKLR